MTILVVTIISSCKSHSVNVISFEAHVVKPGRAEQHKYTTYSLKFINNENAIITNSIKILFNNELEITPLQFKPNTLNVYNLGDTIHCSFSTQSEININDNYILKYDNNKKIKQKKLQHPQLINNSNIPKL